MNQGLKWPAKVTTFHMKQAENQVFNYYREEKIYNLHHTLEDFQSKDAQIGTFQNNLKLEQGLLQMQRFGTSFVPNKKKIWNNVCF